MKVTSINKTPMPLIPETNDDPPSKKRKTLWQRFYAWIIGKLNTAAFHLSHFYFWTKLNWLLPVLALLAITWLFAFCALESWFVKEKVITVAPWNFVRTAKAAEGVEETVWPDIGDCEQYRPIVEKYFGKLTDEALFVASKESGCIGDRVSNPNSDGTKDYCLFQINKEKLAAQSLDVCVRRAWEKYQHGRIGEMNWSAWYAVCDVNAKPKYPKVISNCS